MHRVVAVVHKATDKVVALTEVWSKPEVPEWVDHVEAGYVPFIVPMDDDRADFKFPILGRFDY